MVNLLFRFTKISESESTVSTISLPFDYSEDLDHEEYKHSMVRLVQLALNYDYEPDSLKVIILKGNKMSNTALTTAITAILADGVVDADETVLLRDIIMEDGTVDREEAEALFGLADAVAGEENAVEFEDFFVEAITSHVLEDEVIDEEEVTWLLDMIGADGQVSGLEKNLLEKLREQTGEAFPAKLAELI